MEIFTYGGPILWVLTILSVLSLAIILERLWFFKVQSTDPQKLETALGERLYLGDHKGAAELLMSGKSSLHRVLKVAVDHWKADSDALQILLEQEVRRELFKLERGLSFLAVVSRIAPLLGLLGTILGMIDVFRNLPGFSGANMAMMAEGIWKALITTVAGLSLAIPVILSLTYLQSKVEDMEETLSRGVDFIIREKLLGRGEDVEGQNS